MIGGAAVTRYRDFRFSFDNRIAGQDRINNTQAPAYFFRDGFRSFARSSGTADISQADWLNVKNETALAVDVFILGATSISSGYNESLRLQVPQLKLTKHPTAVSGPGIVTVTIEGMAEYHAGSGTVCTFSFLTTIWRLAGSIDRIRPVPVPVDSYSEMVKRQTVLGVKVNREGLKKALSHLVVSDKLFKPLFHNLVRLYQEKWSYPTLNRLNHSLQHPGRGDRTRNKKIPTEVNLQSCGTPRFQIILP